METERYLKFRLAYLRDANFRSLCENEDVDAQHVYAYFRLRDQFKERWRKLAEHVQWSVFGNKAESALIFDLLRLYVPRIRGGAAETSTACDLTRRQTADLTTLQFIENPERLWESMKISEQLRNGGSYERYLGSLGSKVTRDECLSVANDLVDAIRLAWLVFNVDDFVDFNLEAHFRNEEPRDLSLLSHFLTVAYERAVFLKLVI